METWRESLIVSVLLLPGAALAAAELGRATVWVASGTFSGEWIRFLITAVLLQTPPLIIALFRDKIAYSHSALGNKGAKLIVWGGYELLAGVLMVQMFSSNELWLGSVVLVYVGLSSIIAGAALRVTSSA